MPRCSICKDTVRLDSLEKLKEHLESQHVGKFKVFRCGEIGCLKTYSNWKTLYVHHVTMHKTQKRTNNFPAIRDQPALQGQFVRRNGVESTSSLVVTPHEPTPDEQLAQANGEEARQLPINPHESGPEVLESQMQAIARNSPEVEQQTQKFLRDNGPMFAASLYSDPSLNRKQIQEIVSKFRVYHQNLVGSLKLSVASTLEEENVDEKTIQSVENVIFQFEDPLSELGTDYRRREVLSKRGSYVKPFSQVLGSKVKARSSKNNGTVGQIVDISSQHIPLRETFKKFFETGDNLKIILDRVKSLTEDDTNFSNFCQSELFKQKKSGYGEDDNVVPAHVYFDEWEGNNPLGSHCRKIGGIYTLLPSLPESVASRTKSMFLTCLFEGNYKNDYGFEEVLDPIVEEFSYLEKEGIEVKVGDEVHRVYIVLGQLNIISFALAENWLDRCSCPIVALYFSLLNGLVSFLRSTSLQFHLVDKVIRHSALHSPKV